MISLKELTFLIAKQENKYEEDIKTLRKIYKYIWTNEEATAEGN